jgi:hypothetical protein
MKITKRQFENFKKLCEENDELLFGTDKYLREQLQKTLERQGYWSGEQLRYYLTGDTWRTEKR